jgi:hypothetical protein
LAEKLTTSFCGSYEVDVGFLHSPSSDLFKGDRLTIGHSALDDRVDGKYSYTDDYTYRHEPVGDDFPRFATVGGQE